MIEYQPTLGAFEAHGKIHLIKGAWQRENGTNLKFYCGAESYHMQPELLSPFAVTCHECMAAWAQTVPAPRRPMPGLSPVTERCVEPLSSDRDEHGTPLDQLQIGDPVFYWPEGVDAVVEGYEWQATPAHITVTQGSMRATLVEPPPIIVGYKLNVGITAKREHLMRVQVVRS